MRGSREILRLSSRRAARLARAREERRREALDQRRSLYGAFNQISPQSNAVQAFASTVSESGVSGGGALQSFGLSDGGETSPLLGPLPFNAAPSARDFESERIIRGRTSGPAYRPQRSTSPGSSDCQVPRGLWRGTRRCGATRAAAAVGRRARERGRRQRSESRRAGYPHTMGTENGAVERLFAVGGGAGNTGSGDSAAVSGSEGRRAASASSWAAGSLFEAN